jgi:predicted DNA-binding ribbon-helix-helix protein
MMIRKCMRVGSVRTSIKLEAEFWSFLEELAAGRGLSLARFVSEVANAHPDRTNLASTLRIFALAQARGPCRPSVTDPADDSRPVDDSHVLICPLLHLLRVKMTMAATAATGQIADRRSLPADQERMGVADLSAARRR